MKNVEIGSLPTFIETNGFKVVFGGLIMGRECVDCGEKVRFVNSSFCEDCFRKELRKSLNEVEK